MGRDWSPAALESAVRPQGQAAAELKLELYFLPGEQGPKGRG